jgi:hypothetical protein
MQWLKTHWKKWVGTACGVVVVALEPSHPGIASALSAVCGAAFASDFHAAETLARLARKPADRLPTATVEKE